MFGSTQAAPAPEKKAANIDADQISSNQQSIPVPYVAGWSRGAITYISPVYNQIAEKVTATTGKDEKSTVGYIYYGDFGAIWACVGRREPMRKIRRIIIDASIAWEAIAGMNIAEPYSPITVADYGLVQVADGASNQPADTLVLVPNGTTLPPGLDRRKTSTWPNGDETKVHP